MSQKSSIVIAVIVCSLLGIGIHSYLNSPDKKLSVEEEAKQVSDDQKIANASALSPAVQSGNSAAKKSAIVKKINENYNYIQERLDIMRERRPNDIYDPAEVAAATARTDAWTTLKEIPKDLPLSKEDLADGREFIKFDNLKLETLMPGDNLHLAIKETGQQYDVNIDDVETIDENRTTWRGHIEGTDGHNYEVSLTHGPVITVGGVDTPDGQYIVQAYGEKGWVASSALLFKKHVDPIDPKDVIASEASRHDHNN